jgi:hypothetical protein
MHVALPAGTFLPISNLDLAILKDTGVPVTSFVNCFTRGTRIPIQAGYVLIETLCIGDSVVTRDGSVQPIVWIRHRTIDCRRHPELACMYPICMAAHAFGENLPERHLMVSPNHALYFGGVLIPVRLLVDGALMCSQPCSTVEYYHLELASRDIIFAEGLPTESYLNCGDRGNFSNGSLVVHLFPDFAGSPPGDAWEAHGCAPLCLSGAPLATARALLRRNSEGNTGSLGRDDIAVAQSSHSSSLFDRVIQTPGDSASSHHALARRERNEAQQLVM